MIWQKFGSCQMFVAGYSILRFRPLSHQLSWPSGHDLYQADCRTQKLWLSSELAVKKMRLSCREICG